jgi:hypothetical protein
LSVIAPENEQNRPTAERQIRLAPPIPLMAIAATNHRPGGMDANFEKKSHLNDDTHSDMSIKILETSSSRQD